jgi:hypothetical protein
MVDTATAAIDWYGPSKCEVLDIIVRDVTSMESKLLMRVLDDVEGEDAEQVEEVIEEMKSEWVEQGWVMHHDPILKDTGNFTDAENPFSCHIKKGELNPGKRARHKADGPLTNQTRAQGPAATLDSQRTRTTSETSCPATSPSRSKATAWTSTSPATTTSSPL